jgi:putative PIN family toxin of toxin-antitoxin system
MASHPKTYRVVIDTNIFVSGILVKQGNPNRLLRSWQQAKIALIASPGLIAEVDRTLHRDRIRRKYQVPEEEIQELLASLREAEEGVPQEDVSIASRDIKDDPFLAIALGSGADYLITGDDDLLILNGNPALGNLQIMRVREFLTLLEEQAAE